MLANTRQPARVWRIALGAALLLAAAGNSGRAQPNDAASALGALVGLLTVVGLAVWLIASGLPKWLGDEQLTRLRRRIWYRLLAYGFVTMLAALVVLLSLSQVTAAILVTWVFWFGWTWIAWRMADRRAKEQTERRAVPL